MLLPTDQARTTAATSLMRSIIDDEEKRRVEAEDKARGKKDDQIVKTTGKTSDETKLANEKINAHFFGALKSDQNPLAALISSFASKLGVTQGQDESASAFADRLDQALSFVDLVGKSKAAMNLDGTASVTLAMLKVTTGDLRAAMDPETDPQTISPAAAIAASYVKAHGVTADGVDDTTLAANANKALSVARSELPTSVRSLEKSTGLQDMGITAKEMIEAIRHPWGEAAVKVKDALEKKAEDENTMTAETVKVLQRMEDVANPKTLEELKLERTQKDPTAVEDDETRLEREKDIQARLVSEKVEDVRKVQETLKEHQDATKSVSGGSDKAGDTAAATDGVIDAIATIQTLAAGLQVSQQGDKIQEGEAHVDVTKPDDSSKMTLAGERLPADQQAQIVAASDPAKDGQTPAGLGDILPVTSDENGIYEILKKKEAA